MIESTNPAKFPYPIIGKIGLIFLTVCLAILTVSAKLYAYFPFDILISRFVQMYHPLWFDTYMKIVTNAGNIPQAAVTTGLTTVIFLMYGKTKEIVYLLLSTSSLEFIGAVVKRLINRVRPNPALIHQINHFTRHDSYPSGHVLLFTGFFGLLMFYTYTQIKAGPLRTALLTLYSVLILSIGISRIYVGAHWFSDVLGAYLISILWLIFSITTYRRLFPELKNHIKLHPEN